MADNDRTIAVIAALDEGESPDGQPLAGELQKLQIPSGWTVNAIFQPRAGNLAATYNAALRRTQALCKLYVDKGAVVRIADLLAAALRALQASPGAAALGLYGSELPLSGDCAQSARRYGRHLRLLPEGNKALLMAGANPLQPQRVHVVDGAFFMTTASEPWDEAMDDRFAVAAYCCALRRRGLGVVVPMQNLDWVAVRRPCDYSAPAAAAALERFREKYSDVIAPLVSILIPAYNQPKFFKEALESALAQDYPNTEILVGDDSTDERVKDVVAPYLAEHANIVYDWHGGTPWGGWRNSTTLLASARGEYVNFLFHDDLFAPAKIRRMIEYFVADLSGEIALVTSSRNEIDGDGNERIAVKNPWQPHGDTVFDNAEMARYILSQPINAIGELTTVLLRRADLRQPDGKYAIGLFCGVQDAGMGDLATFLQLFRRYPKSVFIAERLSSFRLHGQGQSTASPLMQMRCSLDWFSYLTMSYFNRLFFRSEAEIRRCYDTFAHTCASHTVFGDAPHEPSEAFDHVVAALRGICEALRAKDYDRAIRLILKHCAERAHDPAAFARTYASYLE